MQNRKTDFGSEALADTDNQRTADAPRIAHGKLQSGGKGFSEQRSARLSHDDGGQRTRKQPDAVQQAFEARRHRFEKRNRSGADDIPAPENHASRNRDDSGHDDVNNSPLLLCFFTTEDSFTVMNVPFSMSRHGKERRPCAGITRYTFIRLKRLLPLSHTAPVSALDTTQGTRFHKGHFISLRFPPRRSPDEL